MYFDYVLIQIYRGIYSDKDAKKDTQINKG